MWCSYIVLFVFTILLNQVFQSTCTDEESIESLEARFTSLEQELQTQIMLHEQVQIDIMTSQKELQIILRLLYLETKLLDNVSKLPRFHRITNIRNLEFSNTTTHLCLFMSLSITMTSFQISSKNILQLFHKVLCV